LLQYAERKSQSPESEANDWAWDIETRLWASVIASLNRRTTR